MRVRLAWISALALLISTARTQGSLEWQRTFGATNAANAVIGCSAQSSGHALVSFAGPDPTLPTSAEIRLVRVDSIGSTDFDLPVANAVTAHFASHLGDSQSNTYLIGEQGQFVDLAATVIKLDVTGSIVWQRSFGQQGTWNQAIGALASDQGVIVASTVNFNDRTDVRRYSPAGQLMWSNELAISPFAEQWNDIAILPDDSFVIVGQTFASQATIARFDAAGQFMWSRNFPAPAGLDDEFLATALLGDGRILACGNRGLQSSSNPAALIGVYTASGTLVDSYLFNGTGSGPDNFVDAARASDGAVWCVGSTLGSTSGLDVLALRWPSGGSALQAHVVSWDSGGFDDEARAVVAGSAGQVWLAGSTSSSAASSDRDGVVIQLAASGQVDWVQTSNIAGVEDGFEKLALGTDRSLVAAGYSIPGANAQVSLARFDIDDSPQGACAPKVNSLGCTPQIVFSGVSSASASAGFVVSVGQVLNQRNGLFVYGGVGTQAPFSGGFLCVAQPFSRSPILTSGGNPIGTTDCSGVMSLDFNAFAAGALGGTPTPLLSTIGATVHCQGWSRDHSSPSTLSLSSSLVFTVLP